MTVSAMQTLVAQILGDTGNTKWSATTHILPSLNIVQKTFVVKVLAYGAGNENIFDALTELQTSTTQSISTSGYDMDGLASTPGPIIPGGYINSKATVDSEVRWVERLPVRSLNILNNVYDKGNDEHPLCYIFTNTYFLEISTGSYPASTTIYYLREPKELVASGATGYQATTCELNSIHHNFLCKMAAMECHRMAGDTINMAKYGALLQETDMEIKAISVGNAVEPQEKQVRGKRA